MASGYLRSRSNAPTSDSAVGAGLAAATPEAPLSPAATTPCAAARAEQNYADRVSIAAPKDDTSLFSG